MASSVTAPLERQFGQMPGLNQMTSTSSGGSSVITLQFSLDLSSGCRRTGSAGGDQCRLHLPAARSAESSGLQQGQSGRCADPDLGIDVRHASPAAGGRPRRYPVRAENFPTLRGGAGQHQRRAAAGCPDPGQSQSAWPPMDLTLEDLRMAVAAANVNQAKGAFDGPRRASIIGANDQLLSSATTAP